MLNIFASERGPWSRNELPTHGIAVERINGLFRAEKYSHLDANMRWDRDTKERYLHDEVWGKWWAINDYLDVPLDFAFDYVSNVYSVEEWSYGIRDLKYINGGLYKGRDRWAKDTEVFIKSEPQTEAKTVDFHYAWDQKEELWMRSFFRFIDAKPVINRHGTLLTWFGCRHPYYDKKTPGLPTWCAHSQNKRGRVWLGDQWRYFWARHRSEAVNLRHILEHRFNNKK